MTIEYDIIEAVNQALIANAGLNKFINTKKDIYVGFPSEEQAVSKNYIVVEAGERTSPDTLYNSKATIAQRYGLDVIITAVRTEDSSDKDNLKKFLEFTSIIENEITSNTDITTKREHVSTVRDYFKDKIWQRAAVITYQFNGVYNVGNL